MVQSEKTFAKDQHQKQSGIGMLLYLVKYSQLDLAKQTRESSKANHCANFAAYKEPLWVIKCVLGMKMLGLKIELTGNANEP